MNKLTINSLKLFRNLYVKSFGNKVTTKLDCDKDPDSVAKKIYDALNWGGAFIIFEKIRAPDARFQDLYSQIYNEFKLKERHTPLEIINKSKSLKGILEPFSDAGNLKLLKTAGFIDITPIFQWVCFKGYICIK